MNPTSNLPPQPIAPSSSLAPKKNAAPWLLPWLVLIAGLIGAYILWDSNKKSALLSLQTRFEYDTFEASSYITQRMKAYELALRGAQGLFASSEHIDRREFREFVGKLDLPQHYPGIYKMGYAAAVPPEQKNRHVATTRKLGFPDYSIYPEDAREIYAPVIYIEPFDQDSQHDFGFDMYSDYAYPREGDSAPGLRQKPMQMARDTGEIAITGKLRFTGERAQDAGAGIIMYLPVYRKGSTVDTIAARRSNLAGWVFASFRMDELMANVLAEHGHEVNIELYDGEEISEHALLYVLDKNHRNGSKQKALFHSSRSITIDGRTWTMVATSLPGLESQDDKAASLKLALSGAAASLLLALLTWLGVHDRELALTIARQANESRTRINHLNEQLARTLKELERIMNAFPDLHFVVTHDGKLARWNSSFEKFLGLAHDDLLNAQITSFIFEEDRPRAMEEIKQAIEQGQRSAEIRLVKRDGVPISFLCNCAAIKSEDGVETNILVEGRDISARKAMENQMEHLAHFDQLTGLPNRALFSDRLQQALAIAKREKERMALMFVDLDEFKPINDDLGHDIGDQLLQQVAQRLQGCMRESDTAARIGGDEFLVLLPQIEVAQDALTVSEKIRLALYQPFNVGGETLRISSSIGVAIYPEHGAEERVLVKNADIAMYHAKKIGRNNVQLYRPGMQEIGG